MHLVPWIFVLLATTELSEGSATLTPDTPLSGKMTADEVISFTVPVTSGNTYLLEVDQGFDLTLSVDNQVGETKSFNRTTERNEQELVLLKPDRDGSYTVELTSRDLSEARKKYSARITQLTPDDEHFGSRVDALEAETRAAAAYARGGEDSWPEVLSAYQEALASWQSLATDTKDFRVLQGALRGQARVHYSLGRIFYWELTDWPSAIEHAGAAAELYRSLGEENLYASVLKLRGDGLVEDAGEVEESTADERVRSIRQAQFDEAFDLFTKAAEIKAGLEESYDHALIVSGSFGYTYYMYLGEPDRAREYYRDALELVPEDEWFAVSQILQNIAVADVDQGRLVPAVESYEQILEILPEDDFDLRATVSDNLANAQRALGRLDEALASNSNALEAHQQRGERKAQGYSLAGIGHTYYIAGDLERAREYFERALPIHHEANDGLRQVGTLQHLGNIFYEQGNLEQAIEAHERAVSLTIVPARTADAQLLLGRDLARAGRSEEALATLQSAVSNAREGHNPLTLAEALTERAAVLREMGHVVESKADAEEALELFTELGVLYGQARSYYELARVAHAADQTDEALEYALITLKSTEALREQITNSDLRASYFGSRRGYYHFYISLLMEQYFGAGDVDHLHTALEASERARARAMVDLLSESSVDIRQGVSEELLQQRNDLVDKLRELRYQQSILIDKSPDSEELKGVLAQLQTTERQLDLLETEIRASRPEFGNLTAPNTLSTKELQTQIDPDTVLLQYALGDPVSYLFVITSDSVHGHQIPGGEEIEALARRAHDALRGRATSREAIADRDSQLRRLSEQVLDPAAEHLESKKRLIVVPDGALNYVPFVALSVADDNGEPRPLLLTHEIVSAPSISAMAVHREVMAMRDSSDQGIAFFADEFFSSTDPRIA